jgi:CubicO group peptidase (beta-lactamase class C family)
LSALALIDSIDAPYKAAAVLGASGVIDERGDVEHRFALASVTKLLATMSCLVAIEEGTIALSDPVGPPGSRLEHVLCHASGIAFDRRSVVLAPPGARRIYSNAGIELATEHLATHAEMGFSEYLRNGVLEPLSMTATAIEGSPASGGIATLRDLEAFVFELLSPSIVSRETLVDATRVHFAGLSGVVPGFGRYDPCDWGIGFELKAGKSPHWTGEMNSPATFGHFGQSGTFVWVDPVAEIATIGLFERPFGDWAKQFWPELSDAVLKERGLS